MSRAVSDRIERLGAGVGGFLALINSDHLKGRFRPQASDFLFGNPHEPALPGFIEALQRAVVPRNKDWYAYTMSDPKATRAAAASLNLTMDRKFSPEHVLMTNGTFAGLAVCMSALVDPGDEVIFISPPWFFYQALIASVGATPVRVDVNRQTWEPEIEAIEAALTSRTRGIIINTPNNPTGRIYSQGLLTRLGEVLSQASERAGRPIYLFSDEAYKKIVFDQNAFPSPVDFYDNSLLLYTYGKTLLTPGQRMGYIALCPALNDLREVTRALSLAQTLTGWAFPNALLQHAAADLEKLSIDIDHLQAKRDRMVNHLKSCGYEVNSPEGAFYLLVRSPWPDDVAFTRHLAGLDIYVLPGATFELDGYFRISLTASDDMIERALPGFARAMAAQPVG